MKSNKAIIVNFILLFFIKNVLANSTDQDIIRLQKEINNLNQKLDDINAKKIDDIKKSILDDIKFNGRLHIEFLDSNNKGNAYGLLNGNIAKTRYNNMQVISLKFGGKKKLSDKSNFVFKVKSTRQYIRFEEVYLDYKILSNLTIDFGQIAIPLSLECENSSNGNSLSRVSRYYTVGNLFFDNGIGLKLKFINNNFGIYSGVYGNAYTDNITDTNRFTFNFRTYYNPYRYENNVIHLGANYFNNVIEHLYGGKIPDASNKNLTYDLKHIENYNVEFAINYNWFKFQTEYSNGFITPSATKYKKRFNISNYYIQTGFMLTGETVEYNNGSFGTVKVNNSLSDGGFGAFEIALRFAKTNMQDIKSNITFDYGKYTEYSLAFNWIPVDFVKIILEYIRVEENFLPKTKNSYVSLFNNNKLNNKYGVIILKGKIFF